LYSCHGLTAYESNPEGTLCQRDAWVYFAFTTAIIKRKWYQDVTNGVLYHETEEIDLVLYQKFMN